MALFGESNPRCKVCGEPTEMRDLVVFPHVVQNRRDPLYPLDDGPVCASCWRSEEPLVHRARSAKTALNARLRVCVVCAAPVDELEDSFITWLITSDESSPVFAFNFLRFHASHFAAWSRAAEFRARMEAFVRSESWAGPELSFDPVPAWGLDPGSPVKKVRIIRVVR